MQWQYALAHGGGAGGGNGGGGAGHAAGEASGHADAHVARGDGNTGTVGPSADGPAALQGRLGAALGALNAAHAAPVAFAHAAPHSRVGQIAAYRSAMLAALVMPTNSPEEIMARDQAIADARATLLARAANTALTPAVVVQVDHLLGLPPSDPTLGVQP